MKVKLRRFDDGRIEVTAHLQIGNTSYIRRGMTPAGMEGKATVPEAVHEVREGLRDSLRTAWRLVD